jgi:hypothetical protein
MVWQVRRADQDCAGVVGDAHSALVACAEVDDFDVFPAGEMEVVYLCC